MARVPVRSACWRAEDRVRISWSGGGMVMIVVRGGWEGHGGGAGGENRGRLDGWDGDVSMIACEMRENGSYLQDDR